MASFISTAIPYVNAKPHIGHAFEYVQADAYVRVLRLAGGDVFFLTGTDDNALKNVQAAESAGVPVKDYVASNAEHFVELDKRLGVIYDDFIRTSVDPRHRDGVEKLWRSTKKKDIYKKSYKGLYCVGCEEFKTEKNLINGECPEHPGKMLDEIEEENYFFRLSSYQDALLELIESNKLKIFPESRKNEITSFIRNGLEDFSVSRSAVRAKGWGIPVPDDSEQYLYVWYDALANYITALGYAGDADTYQKYWVSAEQKIHMIGKGINRFHTVYWPAMLMSAGISPPTTVFVHGYITSGGQKMSKSIGNIIDPNELLDRYGTDAVRYFLLRHGHPTEDFDLTDERCREWYTANLTNGLGNLVARVMKLSEDYSVSILSSEFVFPAEIKNAIEEFRFNDAMDLIWSKIQKLDRRINEEEPYKVIKTDQVGGKAIIQTMVSELSEIGEDLAPFMPETSKKILNAIRENKKPENLFPRL
ncbi:MAG: methionine--tRNA ligase [bacterium]|nr:methionine--tRNA ligase [bacterium]